MLLMIDYCFFPQLVLMWNSSDFSVLMCSCLPHCTLRYKGGGESLWGLWGKSFLPVFLNGVHWAYCFQKSFPDINLSSLSSSLVVTHLCCRKTPALLSLQSKCDSVSQVPDVVSSSSLSLHTESQAQVCLSEETSNNVRRVTTV